MAIYSIYNGKDLKGGFNQVITGYSGGYTNMWSNKSNFQPPTAPYGMAIDLRTMKVLKPDLSNGSAVVSIWHAANACMKLRDE